MFISLPTPSDMKGWWGGDGKCIKYTVTKKPVWRTGFFALKESPRYFKSFGFQTLVAKIKNKNSMLGFNT